MVDIKTKFSQRILQLIVLEICAFYTETLITE